MPIKIGDSQFKIRNKLLRELRRDADRSWSRWAEKQTRLQQRSQQSLESEGYYDSYDPDTERHLVKLVNGYIKRSISITNAGHKSGDKVAVLKAGEWRIRSKPAKS